jgi:hypothetical protein
MQPQFLVLESVVNPKVPQSSLRNAFSRAVGIAAVEFAHVQDQLNLASNTRSVSQHAAIVHLDGIRGMSTKWTAQRGMRSLDFNHQALFSNLDVLDSHSFCRANGDASSIMDSLL